MKRLGAALICLFALLSAQTGLSNEEMYLGITSPLGDMLTNGNPAVLTGDLIPYAVNYGYSLTVEGGDLKTAFAPDSVINHNLSVSAFKEMSNGAVFGGSFTYRDENTLNKMWLHAAENDLLTPFYFADSTVGDYRLNGIDWRILYASSLGRNARFGLDIFYNVDEQFKSVFPKPNIKRNDIHVTPGFVFSGRRAELGVQGSIFSYKENIETKKYSLEQGKTPTFMIIRGLDKPIMSYAETSHERLQTILGLSAGAHLKVNNTLLQGQYEKADGNITDGGAYPVAQGTFETRRVTGSLSRTFLPEAFISIIPSASADIQSTTANHPTLFSTIYSGEKRTFCAELAVPVKRKTGTLQLTGAYAFKDIYEADMFTGCSYYVPSDNISASCRIVQPDPVYTVTLDFTMDYYLPRTQTVYADNTDWYFELTTQKTLDYYTQPRLGTGIDMTVQIPLESRNMTLRFSWYRSADLSNTIKRNHISTGVEYTF